MGNKWLRTSMLVLGVVLVACLVFGAGVFVGRLGTSKSASRPFRMGLALVSGTHGAVGTIQNLQDNQITLLLRTGGTQTVLLNSQTTIAHTHRSVSPSDLKIGDPILVIGSPDASGEIVARYVRVMGSAAAAPSTDQNQNSTNQ